MKKELQDDYKSRMNKVFDYVDKNLDSDLSLKVLAEVASFSTFHFHRVFKFITKETLNNYINRRRLEKSVSCLLHTKLTTSEISYKYGFSDKSSFSKSFKKFYGVSPMAFRTENHNEYGKILPLVNKEGIVYPDYKVYNQRITEHVNWLDKNGSISIELMPSVAVAFISFIGIENLKSTHFKLIQWAKSKNLLNEDKRILRVYHDDMRITEANKVRMSTCIPLKDKIIVDGELGTTTIEKGKFIVGRFKLDIQDFEKAWTGLFIWLNDRGFQREDRSPYEIYYNDFRQDPERKTFVDICIPIK